MTLLVLAPYLGEAQIWCFNRNIPTRDCRHIADVGELERGTFSEPPRYALLRIEESYPTTRPTPEYVKRWYRETAPQMIEFLKSVGAVDVTRLL